MLKFGGVVEDGQSVQRAKYIISAIAGNNTNTITLDGAELIPIDWGGRLVTHPSVSVNELGKQLLKAALDGNAEQVKILLSRGAPFTADWLGTSPLHLAAQNNHLEITQTLLRAGISKDARTKVDRTPLHMAAYEGHLQIVDTLIKNGADIDCKDLLGMTPLHWAVQNGHLEVVAHLLRSGALMNEVNKFDLTPLDIANQIDSFDIKSLLTRSIAEAEITSQNLVIQLSSEESTDNQYQDLGDEMELENNENGCSVFEGYTVDSAVLQEFENPVDETSQNHFENHQIEEETDQERIERENEDLIQHVTVDPSTFTSESLKLLQEHGITMLQNDENDGANILNSIMENGHSVVLTDIGKEVLNSVKQSEQQQQQQPPPVLQMTKKVVTITPEQFLAMTNNKNIPKQLKVLPTRGQFKRVVMKKNKFIPISSNRLPVSTFIPVSNARRVSGEPVMFAQVENSPQNDTESLMSQLVEARKTIEEYKIKLRNKDQEMERYKMEMNLVMKKLRRKE